MHRMRTSTGPGQRLAPVSAWLGGYTEAAQLLAVLPFVIGLASLAISEPEFEPRSVAPQQ